MESSIETKSKSHRLHVHLIQMTTIDETASNLKFIKKSLQAIPDYVPGEGEAEYQLVCFPENAFFCV